MKKLVVATASLAALVLVAAAENPRPVLGVDRAYLDPTVSPGANFYAYANGSFSKVPIPGEYPAYGVNQEIDERSYLILKDILETSARTGGAPGTVAQRVGDFYAAGMDEAAIEKSGLAPLQPWLDAIAASKTPGDLRAVIGRLYAAGLETTFNFGVQVDDKDTTAMIAGFNQGGLGLPERDYYFRPDEKSAETRQAYVAHVARTLELAGDTPAAARTAAAAIMDLETKLAKASRTLVERRDPEKNYNKFERGALAKLSAGVDWEGFFSRIGFPAGEKTVLVGQPEFYTALGGLLESEPAATWRAYLRWHVLHQASNYLGQAFVDERFAFYGKKLSGTTELKPRWKRVLAAADQAIGEDLGQLYVRTTFSPAAKERALTMVRFHLQAMRNRIHDAAWMSDATKAQAYKKLDTMRSKVGYPDKWRDYAKLTLSRVLSRQRARRLGL